MAKRSRSELLSEAKAIMKSARGLPEDLRKLAKREAYALRKRAFSMTTGRKRPKRSSDVGPDTIRGMKR